VKISDREKKHISKLITEGEKLNPLDLEDFYRWLHASYEALGFNPLQQQRFEDYCRSSCDSNSMRVYIGAWILKLALREASFFDKDYRGSLS
jgi:hypothetical protein